MRIYGPLSALGSPLRLDLDTGHNASAIAESIYSEEIKLLLQKKFKKDIYVNSYIERLYDTKVYYITTDNGRRDELYYFSSGGRWFHGETEWSQYHPFLASIENLQHSAIVKCPSFFIGTRDNYTHQMIDFFPSIFLLEDDQSRLADSRIVLGSPNTIFGELHEKYASRTNRQAPKDRFIWLSKLGEEVTCGGWKVRCILFKDIILVKHHSTFEALRKMREWLHYSGTTCLPSTRKQSRNRLAYIRRGDSRVKNEDEIETLLRLRFDAVCIDNIHVLTFDEKLDLLSQFSHLVIPPGSDTINALCFSNDGCQLIQLTGAPIEKMFNNPFYSFASLRYFLPFLGRMTMISPEINTDLHAGKWSVERISSELAKSIR